MNKTSWLAAAVAAGIGMGSANAATTWRFELGGWLSSLDSFGPAGGRTALTGDTPFTFNATFRSADELTGPVPPGFSAFSPLSASMTLLGQTYEVLTYAQDAESGVAVLLFDPSNVFNPGFWAAGIHADPLSPDTGIVARFGMTSSGLSVEPGALTATTFGDFRGAGYGSGTPDTPGPGFRCWPGGGATCAIEPFLLTSAGGGAFELAIASRPYDATPGGVAFAASLTAVPLPGGMAFLLTALGMGALVVRRRA